MPQGLRRIRGLEAVVQINASVAASMKDLLNGNGPVPVKHLRNPGYTRDEPIVVQAQLGCVRFAHTTLVRIGPLIGENAASHLGDDLVAGKFPLCERAIRIVVIGDAAGGVFHPVFRLKFAKLPFAEHMWKLFSAITHQFSPF
jgi:hypothetical protein